MKEFYSKMADILEVCEVHDDDQLKDYEAWDSLTRLSIIALADSDYKVALKAKDFEIIQTIGDLKKKIINEQVR